MASTRDPDGRSPAQRRHVSLEAAAEFRIAGPGDEEALTELFEDIDETFFRPHPLTSEEARRLCHYPGRDVHALLALGGRPVAYGMLRGWDEGYDTPSLGIAVRNDSQGRGYGRLMMAPPARRGPRARYRSSPAACAPRQCPGQAPVRNPRVRVPGRGTRRAGHGRERGLEEMRGFPELLEAIREPVAEAVERALVDLVRSGRLVVPPIGSPGSDTRIDGGRCRLPGATSTD